MVEKRKGLARRIGKAVLVIAGGLVIVAAAAHLIWKYSGDNQPKLVIDRGGIKVYTVKTPGETLLKIKAERVVRSSLDRAAAAHLDGSLENCHDWIPACIASKSVKPWDPKERDYTQLWLEAFPEPFASREFLLHTQFKQDGRYGPITVELTAVPDALPRNDCCFRLTQMHAVWRLIPLDNGYLKVELMQDVDAGVPYFLFNAHAAEGVYGAFADLPRLYAKAKYKDVSIDRIYNGLPIVDE